MAYTSQDIIDAYNQTVGAGTMSVAEFVQLAMSPKYNVTADQLMAARDVMLSSQGTDAGATTGQGTDAGATTGQGALATATSEAALDSTIPAEDIYTSVGTTGAGGATGAAQIVDYTGKSYDVDDVVRLANELKLSTDPASLSGGVYKTQGQSVGFDYSEVQRVLGGTPNTYTQVLLDSARQLIDQGIYSLSDLRTREIGRDDVAVYYPVDDFGRNLGPHLRYYDFVLGQNVERPLTADEISQIRTEEVGSGGENSTTRSYLDDFVPSSLELVGPGGKVLSTTGRNFDPESGAPIGGPLQLYAGETFTGKGSTLYNLTFGADGKPSFRTFAESSAAADLVQGIAFVTQFIPGFQPFAMALNAVNAAANGNVVGALASLAGAGGSFFNNPVLTNIGTTLNVANAVKNGDVAGLITAIAGNPTISDMAGSTMLTDTISLRDVGNAVRIGASLADGNYGAAISAAGDLTGNSDFRIAGAALNIVTELSKDNPNMGVITSALTSINNITNKAASNVDANTAANIATSVVNNTASDITATSNTTDLASAAYVGAINVGMSEADAKSVADVIAGTQGGTADATTGIIQTGGDTGVVTTGVDTRDVVGTDLGTLGVTTAQEGAITEAGSGVVGGAKPDTVQDRIGGAKTFGEAFAAAREELGPGKTFTWQGKNYSTATFAERPDLAGTSVVPGAASTTAGGGRGSYAGFDPDAAAAAFNTELALNTQRATEAATSTSIWQKATDWLQNTMKMSSQAANDYLRNNPDSPFTQSVSTAMEAAGELQRNVAGGTALLLGNKPVADAFIKGGDEMIKFGQSIGSGPQDSENWRTTVGLIDAAKGFEKLGVLAGRIMDGTSGLGRQVVVELRQELPALFLGGGSAMGILAASGVIDTADTAGNAAIEAFDESVKAGKNLDSALSDARRAGAAAGAAEAAIQLTLGKLADVAIGRFDNLLTKGVTRTTGEGIVEGGQEGASSAAVDLVLGRDIDVNRVLTQTVVGGATGKGTATATTPVTTAQDAGTTTAGTKAGTTTAGTKAGTTAADVSNIVSEGVASGANTTDVVGSTVADAVNSGANVDQTVGAAVIAGTDAGLGASNSAAIATNAAVNSGADANVAADAATNAAANTGSNVTVSSAVNANTNTTTTKATDTNANTNTTVTTNNNTNVTVNTNTNNNTNTSTTTVTDKTTNNTVTVKTNTDTEEYEVDTTGGDTTGGDTTITTTVIDDSTIDMGDGVVIDTTTGEKLPPEEVEKRKEAAKSKPPKLKLPRQLPRQLPRTAAPRPIQEPAYPYKPTGIEETWLGGRFLQTLPFAAMYELMPEDTPIGQEAQALSALRRAAGIKEGPEQERPDYYAYGREPNTEQVLAPFMNGGTVQRYDTGGKIMPSPLQAAGGGNVPHKGSHYVQGAGGGQDDLIPAKLADGEYVFDAEIVAALGDGSNKEGARKLDAMREAIRRHKRSGSLKSIPPKAKSPLQYLKEATK